MPETPFVDPVCTLNPQPHITVLQGGVGIGGARRRRSTLHELVEPFFALGIMQQRNHHDLCMFGRRVYSGSSEGMLRFVRPQLVDDGTGMRIHEPRISEDVDGIDDNNEISGEYDDENVAIRFQSYCQGS